MKSPPLAFTEDNFVSVIQGNKTETRRLVTLKGRTQEEVNGLTSFCQDGDGNWIGHFGNTFGDLAELAEFTKKAYPKGSNKGIKSRLQIGDRAYLKEPTQIESFMDERNQCLVQYFWHKPETTEKTLTNQDLNKINERKTGWYSKQSQMFMLKSFARYHVEIVDVRIERLMDITEEGAIAEGIHTLRPYPHSKLAVYKNYHTGLFDVTCARKSYISEIEMLHGKEIAQSNPWLWVYKFKFLGDNS